MTMPSIGIGEGRRVVTGRTDMLAVWDIGRKPVLLHLQIRVQIATPYYGGSCSMKVDEVFIKWRRE